MANTPETIPVADNAFAPDVFADNATGVFFLNGNIHVTFTTQRCDYSKQPGIFTNVVW